MTLFLFLYIPTITVAIAFLASLTLYLQPSKEVYLRFFPFFLLCEGTVTYWLNYQALKGENNVLIVNLFTSCEFAFYLFVLHGIIRNRKPRRILLYGIPAYLALSLVNIFLVQMASFHTMTFSLGCLLIVIFCIYYFWELFQGAHSVSLLQQPSFWIASGLLFYSVCNFPIYGLINFIKITRNDSLAGKLITISTLLYIFLFLSFTIAFLCRLKTRKSMSSF